MSCRFKHSESITPPSSLGDRHVLLRGKKGIRNQHETRPHLLPPVRYRGARGKMNAAWNLRDLMIVVKLSRIRTDMHEWTTAPHFTDKWIKFAGIIVGVTLPSLAKGAGGSVIFSPIQLCKPIWCTFCWPFTWHFSFTKYHMGPSCAHNVYI